jgi:thiol-disulfide isomerase/thioredoxin
MHKLTKDKTNKFIILIPLGLSKNILTAFLLINKSNIMNKKIVLIIILLFTTLVNAQNNKRIWAKSFLNKKAPELVVAQWINKKPNTENKFILLDFWATWCAPCRRVIPKLNYFQERFSDDLIIIGLSDQNAEALELFNSDIDYYHATDPKKRLKNTYQVTNIPHSVLIDPDGIVRWEGYPLLQDHLLTAEVIQQIIDDYYAKH